MAQMIGNTKVVLLAGGLTAVALAFTGCSNSSSSTATPSESNSIVSEAASAASEAASGASEAASAAAAEASALSSASPANIDEVLETQWGKMTAEQQTAFCTEYKAATPAEAYKTWATTAATEAGMTTEAFAELIPEAKFEGFYTPKCA